MISDLVDVYGSRMLEVVEGRDNFCRCFPWIVCRTQKAHLVAQYIIFWILYGTHQNLPFVSMSVLWLVS